ncbi:MAG: hypothetical protein HFF84_02170 [Oscillibacter sp.]|nr:hypothetical protein [Oscillibacter sp.]
MSVFRVERNKGYTVMSNYHLRDKSLWQITENVHEPVVDRADFENVQRILENALVKRPNGDGEIHPLSRGKDQNRKNHEH